jgi:tetratricopeptide (TPR) repeat protein
MTPSCIGVAACHCQEKYLIMNTGQLYDDFWGFQTRAACLEGDRWSSKNANGLHLPSVSRLFRISALLVIAVAAHPMLLPSAGAQPQNKTSPAERSSSGSSAILDQAKKLVQQGDPQGALSLLEQTDMHGSSASDLHAVRGICLALLSKPIESAAEFEQAIALRPNYAPNYLSSGLAYATFNNLDRALDRLSEALKLDPSLPGVRYNYALVLARAGKYAESEKQVDLELQSKTRATDSAPDLWRLKARDAYYQKKWADTIDAYRKTLALNPDWPEAFAAIGEALFSLNRSQESMVTLEKAVSLDGENEAPHALLAKLYQEAGKREQAIAEFEAAHHLMPSDREVTYRLYRIYSLNGDSASAGRLQKDLEDLLAGNHAEADGETKAMVLNNTGIELEKKGNLAGALDQYDQASKADVSNIIFQRNAALILCKTGRVEEAIRRLRDILQLDADDAETLQILAVANEVAAGNLAVRKTLPAPQSSH